MRKVPALSSVPFPTLRQFLIGLAFLVCFAYLGYFPAQNDFIGIAVGYIPAFVLYGLILRRRTPALRWWLGVAVVVRLILLPAPPLLSDDTYRFLWDGHLLAAGLNPFEQLPGYYLTEPVPGLTPELYDRLNSPEYFTIYPPVAQLAFLLSVWIGTTVAGSTLVLKLIVIGFELGTLFLLPKLLRRYGFPAERALLYALNPLLILEISGNLHFEGVMVFFLAAALWYLAGQKPVRAAVFLSLSIASKLLPLMFAPLLLRRLPWGKLWPAGIALVVVCGLLFAPLVSGVFLENFGSSLDLYFRKFEFNASVYYLARWVGYLRVGWNQIATIGPALALCSLAAMLFYTLLEKRPTLKNLPAGMLFFVSVYLVLATTVHPWYLALPVFLCAFTQFRYPIVWSALIWLTYINYSYDPYRENLWIVGLEYTILFGFILYELMRYYQRKREDVPAVAEPNGIEAGRQST